MSKKKKQTLAEREKNKKGDGTITKVQLGSCYVASALIAVLCVMEALKPETQESGDPAMYYILAVLGVVFSVFITFRHNGAKKEKKPEGKRLK